MKKECGELELCSLSLNIIIKYYKFKSHLFSLNTLRYSPSSVPITLLSFFIRLPVAVVFDILFELLVVCACSPGTASTVYRTLLAWLLLPVDQHEQLHVVYSLHLLLLYYLMRMDIHCLKFMVAGLAMICRFLEHIVDRRSWPIYLKFCRKLTPH